MVFGNTGAKIMETIIEGEIIDGKIQGIGPLGSCFYSKGFLLV